ncbi:hypothetical protein F2Q70_00026122 [Brassica cretica]|uniref:Uncharacterized protein n=1 Tax=Brassica cretica TaxID=69181 RepID=A0A8S9L672_BRACR|nr:hypothetical protein F2Q70_00026122 [Brassica cretica]
MDAQLLDKTESEAELEEDELIDHVPGDKGASDQRTEPDLNWSYEDHFARSCEHGEQEEQHIESLDQAVQEDGRVKAHAAKDGPDGQQQQQPDSFWTGSTIRARAKTHQEAIQHLANCVRKKEEKRTEGEHKLGNSLGADTEPNNYSSAIGYNLEFGSLVWDSPLSWCCSLCKSILLPKLSLGTRCAGKP